MPRSRPAETIKNKVDYLGSVIYFHVLLDIVQNNKIQPEVDYEVIGQ